MKKNLAIAAAMFVVAELILSTLKVQVLDWSTVNSSILIIAVLATIVAIVALFIKLLAYQTDKAYSAMGQMHRDTVQSFERITTRQMQMVERAIEMGAELYQLQNGKYIAALPDGTSAPVSAIEAEYWNEIE